ncbi:MAG: peptidoglycan binding protein CsiV [Gammaproteobacteria bacterium]|nr:peptidoglycan binding protein CsiV [Gammaproteobacteria bacterium]
MPRIVRPIKALAPLLLLLVVPGVQAQDDVLQQETVIPRYTVEMIIFRYLEDVGVGSEVFLTDTPEGEPVPFDAQPPVPAEQPARAEKPKPIGDPERRLLAADEYSMRDTLRRLELLEAYDPLLHFGWSQATWPADQTRPIDLAAMARPPATLDGTLMLYLGRYLHLVVDLAFEAEQRSSGVAATNNRAASYGDQRLAGDAGEFGIPGPVRYRIAEDRILRNGEVRYFDHPKFGVLAKVTREESDESETSSTDSP